MTILHLVLSLFNAFRPFKKNMTNRRAGRDSGFIAIFLSFSFIEGSSASHVAFVHPVQCRQAKTSQGGRHSHFKDSKFQVQRHNLLQPLINIHIGAQEKNNGRVGISLSMTNTDDGSLQALFTKLCDQDGLMTKDSLLKLEDTQSMLSDGDLLQAEFDDIWTRAPKFPVPSGTANGVEEKIDVDSFIQVYRDIDDLFEDDDDEEANDGSEQIVDDIPKPVTPTEDNASNVEKTVAADEEDPYVAMDEEELEDKFKEICDASGLLSKDTLRKWEEISNLISEGMLGLDEFNQLWESTNKRPGTESLDVDGFLSFNVALDDLFVFEEIDDGKVDESAEIITRAKSSRERVVITEYDLPPAVIFAAIANENLLVGLNDLFYWGELREVLDSGELKKEEIKDMFEKIPKTSGSSDKIDENGFVLLYDTINDLFEEEVDTDADKKAISNALEIKEKLLSMLRKMESSELPCGLVSSEKTQEKVLSLVGEVERSPTNIVTTGNVDKMSLVGVWDLVYTSSGMMQFNQGLTGLGGSVPNGKFESLKQKLTSSKYVSDVEYIERIAAVPDTSSFDAIVTGDWELKKTVSLLTGSPSIIMVIEPKDVKYGPTSTRADHWKSVRSMNMLDLSYLDDDTRIMRGNTSTDTLFIFKRA